MSNKKKSLDLYLIFNFLFVDVSGYNTKDDVYYIKREIALSTNAEYLKQLVSQLSILSTGKDYIKVILFDERI